MHAEAPGSAELWDRAVELAGENAGWVPGLVQMSTEELNRKGELKNSRIIWMRLILGENGEIASETVKYLDNGTDKTQERSDSSGPPGSQGNSSSFWSMDDTPFAPDAQNRVTREAVGRTEILDGRPVQTFRYELVNRDGDIMEGTVWIDVEHGAPVRMDMVPKPLPRFVSSLQTSIYFTYTDDEHWLPTRMEIEGEGGFLLVRRAFTMKALLSDHWRIPVGSSAE